MSLDLVRHQLFELLKMDVAGRELHEAIDCRDDGLPEMRIGHAGGAPRVSGTCYIPIVNCCSSKAICGHGVISRNIGGTR
jgi:hypothetical protein